MNARGFWLKVKVDWVDKSIESSFTVNYSKDSDLKQRADDDSTAYFEEVENFPGAVESEPRRNGARFPDTGHYDAQGQPWRGRPPRGG